MDITIHPGKLHGTIHAIPSKSQAHRLLICAAFADKDTVLTCPQSNQDIEATADCLRAIGAQILRTETGYCVQPIQQLPAKADLYCNESGSTLRFMLPIVGALGICGTFHLRGRLPERPLSPMWEEMERMGCNLSRPTPGTIMCTGKLQSGHYRIAGNVSSQFITGLLFALTLLDGESVLAITSKIESRPYVDMTVQALAKFGVKVDNFVFTNRQRYVSPGSITVEGDWSNAAFFLAAAKVGSAISVLGLNASSSQGDRAIATILDNLSENITLDVADIPDLVPILAVTAAANRGATFVNISRLRLKESDRVEAVYQMLRAFGIGVSVSDNILRVLPGNFTGCTVDSHGDHRIAMAAAIASTVADGPVTILNADCVAKSYPSFWTEFSKLGGSYEQYIR